MKVVFVHGALVFDGAWWWHRMVEPLATLGLGSRAVELPSCVAPPGASRGTVGDMYADADAVRAALVFWFVFIIAITMAADALDIPQVSVLLEQLIAYIPSIIAAILIMILAALLANFLSDIVRGATGSDVVASVARYAVIVYAVFAALTQLGIAVQLTANTFLIVLGAVALAAAIAFGIGGREVAHEILEKAYHRSDEVADGTTGRRGGAGDQAGGGGGEGPDVHRLRRDE